MASIRGEPGRSRASDVAIADPHRGENEHASRRAPWRRRSHRSPPPRTLRRSLRSRWFGRPPAVASSCCSRRLARPALDDFDRTKLRAKASSSRNPSDTRRSTASRANSAGSPFRTSSRSSILRPRDLARRASSPRGRRSGGRHPRARSPPPVRQSSTPTTSPSRSRAVEAEGCAALPVDHDREATRRLGATRRSR